MKMKYFTGTGLAALAVVFALAGCERKDESSGEGINTGKRTGNPTYTATSNVATEAMQSITNRMSQTSLDPMTNSLDRVTNNASTEDMTNSMESVTNTPPPPPPMP